MMALRRPVFVLRVSTKASIPYIRGKIRMGVTGTGFVQGVDRRPVGATGDDDGLALFKTGYGSTETDG
ncbi:MULTISPECIES: hypothetical protein [Marinobacter]|uniref:Uncharacterized protein n=1 Tax=Marinobacter metalliresistant TaxID=2961995 RepID=A0ABZ2VXS5_9GAMM|nr:hypothetical protein [Marinobacter sp. Arc7-DN-1]AXS83769.1 hypothetical protein D0851_12440 [Marinobacter sp. Arc7-DN-1]